MSNIETPALDVERAVKDRYASAAREREASLCCPVEYDARYLEAIPPEVLERDYGCGDPSRYVKPGDVVLFRNVCGANSSIGFGGISKFIMLKVPFSATTKVVLHKTAVVNGNINTPSVVIEEGAVLNGQLEMGGSSDQKSNSGALKSVPTGDKS